MENKPKEVIFFRESWIGSIVSDTVTFSIPAALAWANYQYLGNSGIFQFAIVIIFFITASAKGSGKCKRFHSKKELLEYLQPSDASKK